MIRRAWGVERVGLKYQYVLPTRSEPVKSISLRFRGQDGMGKVRRVGVYQLASAASMVA